MNWINVSDELPTLEHEPNQHPIRSFHPQNIYVIGGEDGYVHFAYYSTDNPKSDETRFTLCTLYPSPDGACFVIDDEYEALPPNLVKRWKLFQSAGKVL